MNPISRRPPVPYWDLWPAGPESDPVSDNAQLRKVIRESSVSGNWHFYALPVWTEQAVAAGSTIEGNVFSKNLGWIFKVEYLAVTASNDLFLTCQDSSSGRVLFNDVCTQTISGGDPGKSYVGFAYILGPRFPVFFSLENRGLTTVRPSLVLLGKVYRGEL